MRGTDPNQIAGLQVEQWLLSHLSQAEESRLAAAYRFGFNGKENDREWGSGRLTQDYGFRLYNLALGKFLSVDPLAPSYPWNSTYAFAENRVIDGVDLDGLEYLSYKESRIEVRNGKTLLKLENFTPLYQWRFSQLNYDSRNWETDPNSGRKNIGVSITVANFKLIAPTFTEKPRQLSRDNSNPNFNDNNIKIEGDIKLTQKDTPICALWLIRLMQEVVYLQLQQAHLKLGWDVGF